MIDSLTYSNAAATLRPVRPQVRQPRRPLRLHRRLYVGAAAAYRPRLLRAKHEGLRGLLPLFSPVVPLFSPLFPCAASLPLLPPHSSASPLPSLPLPSPPSLDSVLASPASSRLQPPALSSLCHLSLFTAAASPPAGELVPQGHHISRHEHHKARGAHSGRLATVADTRGPPSPHPPHSLSRSKSRSASRRTSGSGVAVSAPAASARGRRCRRGRRAASSSGSRCCRKGRASAPSRPRGSSSERVCCGRAVASMGGSHYKTCEQLPDFSLLRFNDV